MHFLIRAEEMFEAGRAVERSRFKSNASILVAFIKNSRNVFRAGRYNVGLRIGPRLVAPIVQYAIAHRQAKAQENC